MQKMTLEELERHELERMKSMLSNMAYSKHGHISYILEANSKGFIKEKDEK